MQKKVMALCLRVQFFFFWPSLYNENIKSTNFAFNKNSLHSYIHFLFIFKVTQSMFLYHRYKRMR